MVHCAKKVNSKANKNATDIRIDVYCHDSLLSRFPVIPSKLQMFLSSCLMASNSLCTSRIKATKEGKKKQKETISSQTCKTESYKQQKEQTT